MIQDIKNDRQTYSQHEGVVPEDDSEEGNRVEPASGDFILIVEDDGEIREQLEGALEDEGYRVLSAPSGGEALRLLHEGWRPALILLDLMMPGVTGWELFERVRAGEASEVPVIIVSAFENSARTLHAEGFLKKPVDLDDLVAVAEKYAPSARE